MYKYVAAVLFAVSLCTASVAWAAEKVRLVYVEWPCATITHYIAQAALEERLGLQVELMPVSVPLMFQALANKQADASMSVWLPTTHASYLEKLGGKLQDLGPLVGGAKLGWVVPDYVPITAMEGLRGQAGKFRGKVYGIEPGAVYNEQSKQAIIEYGLDGFELVESSDALMVATLADAIKREQWVVILGWSPHWMFARYKIHYLDDPGRLFGAEESIHVVARLDLDKDNPKLYSFLDNFYFTDTLQLQILMDAIQSEDPAAVAKRFIQENRAQVDSWFK
jgi:glycine betaine/proline transport system substrate-binding protein